MKFDFKEIDKKWKEYALAGCVCVLFFVCLTNLGKIWSVIAGFINIMKPVIFGGIIAYIINPIAVFFQKRIFVGIKKEKLQWKLSAIISVIVTLCLIVVLVLALIPQIADSVMGFAENYPSYVEGLISFLNNIKGRVGDLEIIDTVIKAISSEGGLFNQIGKLLADNSSLILEKTTSFGAAAINWLIGLVFAIYFLMAKQGVLAVFSKISSLLLSPLKYERFKTLVNKFNGIFSKYIVCELIDSLIIFGTTYIFMLVMGMPNAVFISVVMGITNLAPTFGPIVGAVISAFILILVNPVAVIPFLIFTAVDQLLDGYVIKPKLFGDALNVPGVIILIAIIVFGKLLGIPGMLLAIPFAAIIVYVYTEGLIPTLELNKDLKKYKKERFIRKKDKEQQ